MNLKLLFIILISQNYLVAQEIERGPWSIGFSYSYAVCNRVTDQRPVDTTFIFDDQSTQELGFIRYTETPMIIQNIGIKCNYFLTKRFNVGTGLKLNSFGYKFTWNRTYYNPTYYNFNSGKEETNIFGYVGIPVSLSYHFIQRKKFGLSGEFLFQAHRLKWEKGKRTEYPVSSESHGAPWDEPYFYHYWFGMKSNQVTNWNFSSTISVGIELFLTNRFSLELEPYVEFLLKPILQTSEIKHFKYGLSGSINYSFGGENVH